MSWFQPPDPPPEPPKPPRPPAWMGPRDNELGTLLDVQVVLAASEKAWVILSGIVCYGNGFEVGVTVRTREGAIGMPGMPHGPVSGGALPPDLLRLGVEFSDGRRATSVGRMPPSAGQGREGKQPEGPVLVQRGGSGGHRRADSRYWVWPLPPAGPLKVGCEWPAMDIPFSVRELDAGRILEASARSERLWDEPESGGGPMGSGWASYSGGR